MAKYESTKRAVQRWAKRNPQYFRDWMKERRDGLHGPFSERDGPDWQTKNREHHLQRKRVSANACREKDFLEAIEHYGKSQCFCCGEKEPLFLALDHIEGGGNQHRKTEKVTHAATWAKRKGWPAIFRVACHNCNHGIHRLGGTCPHQLKKRKKAA